MVKVLIALICLSFTCLAQGTQYTWIEKAPCVFSYSSTRIADTCKDYATTYRIYNDEGILVADIVRYFDDDLEVIVSIYTEKIETIRFQAWSYGLKWLEKKYPRIKTPACNCIKDLNKPTPNRVK
jgi:hypothetical protein